jgi:hypothetical protein
LDTCQAQLCASTHGGKLHVVWYAMHNGVGARDSGGRRQGMTSVGSIVDLVQLPDTELSTDNMASSPTTTSSGQCPPLQHGDESVIQLTLHQGTRNIGIEHRARQLELAAAKGTPDRRPPQCHITNHQHPHQQYWHDVTVRIRWTI